MPEQSPSQTIGPFFHNVLIRGSEHIMTNAQTSGTRIVLTGKVLDGDGASISDALVEIWQADGNGRFNHPNDPQHANADPHFRGFGRSRTEEDGQFTFHTIKPGIINGEVVPHINVRVFARGMLIHAVTRLYFAEQPKNELDPVFAAIPEKRRSTLLAKRQPDAPMPTYRFDIHLQGEQETVFFNP